MQIRHDAPVPVSVEAALAALADPAFHIRRLRRDPATVEVTATPTADGFDLAIRQYRRGPTGVDRGAIDPATQRFRRSGSSLAWTWEQGGPLKLTLSGSFTVLPDPRGARVRAETDVTIRVPVLGGMLEKMVAKAMGASNATLADDIAERAGA